MLFNSYSFILLFLPVVLLGFFLFARVNHVFPAWWLAAASLFFYGYWNMVYVGLLLGSIVCNYILGLWIAKAGVQQETRNKKQETRNKKHLLIVAITANLLLLAYFKYANFFVGNINSVAGTQWNLGNIILPLGISFFTFTQIAFLVDAYQGKVKEYNFIHYTLFVTYFPHLIAGPILHHGEMMPQFSKPSTYRIHWEHIAVGLTIFTLGLAKKCLIADPFGELATPIFDAVGAGGHPMLFEAWIGALAYTFQLYFDFSGYSDMAIGLSLMFNIRLPLNFYSPYKATSVIEFWRRWHMTLSRFLRDYLYIPLGGNRRGKFRRYQNLVITMLLGGLWHGAGWTFIIWGGLHGFYLMINHAWFAFRKRIGVPSMGAATAGMLTFFALVIGWVFFRADNVTTAVDMVRGMVGLNGVSFSEKLGASAIASSMKHYGAQFLGVMPLTDIGSGEAINILILGMLIVFKLPNVQQIFQRYSPSLIDGVQLIPMRRSWLARCCDWQPKPVYAWATGLLFVYAVLSFTRISEFLYFQF